MDMIDEYRAVLDGYQQGMYTQGEVVSTSLGLLFRSSAREALWAAFEPEHREFMAKLLKEFDPSAEPFAIKADPIQVWREMSDLKQWLVSR